jgi:hypothetical protein
MCVTATRDVRCNVVNVAHAQHDNARDASVVQ